MKVTVRPRGIYINDSRYNYTMLDNFIKNPPDLIDIDMFGSEIDCTQGAAQTITIYRPELLITLHEDRIMKERERIIGLLTGAFDLPIDVVDEDGGGSSKLHVFIRDMERGVSYFRGHKFEYYRLRGPEPIFYFTGWTSEVKLREKCLRDDEVVYDIGAHIGGWTIPAAIVGKHVYSFEPNKDCVQILNENILLNKLQDKVSVYNTGCGGSVRPCYNDNNTTESIRLDEFLGPPPDFIKIDVEGAELDVIKGAEEMIKKFKPRIFVEAHTIDGYNSYEDIMKTVMEFVPDITQKLMKGHGLYSINNIDKTYITIVPNNSRGRRLGTSILSQHEFTPVVKPGQAFRVEPLSQFGYYIVPRSAVPEVLPMEAVNLATPFTTSLTAMSDTGQTSPISTKLTAMDVNTLQIGHYRLVAIDPLVRFEVYQPGGQARMTNKDGPISFDWGNTQTWLDRGLLEHLPEIFVYEDKTPITVKAYNMNPNAATFQARFGYFGYKYPLEVYDMQIDKDTKKPLEPCVTIKVAERS